jgi:hypothetical protein
MTLCPFVFPVWSQMNRRATTSGEALPDVVAEADLQRG